MRAAEYRYKGRLCSYIGYNGELSHRIYAGSDLFLMPSLFEPCGISQMIAMRYGTLPIVRETGGLRDTVQPYDALRDAGNGYSFANYSSGDMLYVSYPIATEEVAGSYCYTKYTFSAGDANFVNGVDITDLQATINYIFGSYNTYPFNFTAADTYQDGRLNVQDVVCTANIIMDAEETQTESRALDVRKAPALDGDATEASLYIRDGAVVLYTEVPVASFDILFEGSADLNFNLESQGYDVLDKIAAVETGRAGYFENVPKKPVVILSVKRA